MNENKYDIRTNCIFCDTPLNKTFFKEDLKNYVAHYAVDFYENDFVSIPYNVCLCKKCKTPQNKYLARLDDVYKINHADSTGTTMVNLHKESLKMILKYKDSVRNIVEIGSSVGVLADMILENIDLTYNIIEPSYFGNNDGKVIYADFYENIDDTKIDANTMIISHVFEHFYNPKEIVDKIYKNKNIENLFLVFPDLEYYINNNVLHVLNTEHTYYVDSNFLIDFFKSNGFDLVEKSNYKNHSILFYFKRNEDDTKETFESKNKSYDIEKYFSTIYDTISSFNEIIENNKNTYLWPASIHTLYLMIFGLNYDKISGFLDNSTLKINKKMYGTDKIVYSFYDKIKEDSIVLINGGVFNSEVEEFLKDNKIKYYTYSKKELVK
jgi:hypothetical protein